MYRSFYNSQFRGFFRPAGRQGVAFRMTMVAAFLLLPLVAQAATVGFVPSTGIWFSRTELKPNESVYLYTVVMNNAFASVDAAVGFYDNDVLFGRVAVKNISKETAEQIKIVWQPTEGNHTLQARLAEVAARNEKGEAVTIPDADVARVTGIPLVINAQSVVPLVLSSIPGTQNQPAAGGGPSSGSVLGATPVSVQRVNGQIEITPQVLGEKITASPTSSSSAPSIVPEEDFFAKNRAALEAARSAIQTVTTTAATINKAYAVTKDVVNQGREVVNQGQQIYEQGKDLLAKAKPLVDKLTPWWNKLSKNNDPKRILIIIGIILIVYLSIRRNRRREDYYDR